VIEATFGPVLPCNAGSNAAQKYPLTAEGVTVKHAAPIFELARELIRQGTDPDRLMRCWRDGAVVWMPAAVWKTARWTISEGESGIRRRPYLPHPTLSPDKVAGETVLLRTLVARGAYPPNAESRVCEWLSRMEGR
jgi:hypothetical protein